MVHYLLFMQTEEGPIQVQMVPQLHGMQKAMDHIMILMEVLDLFLQMVLFPTQMQTAIHTVWMRRGTNPL